jgi:hypothetical protein
MPKGGDRTKYRIILGEEDLYSQIIKILRGVLPDRNGDFTCEVIQLFSEVTEVPEEEFGTIASQIEEVQNLFLEKKHYLTEISRYTKSITRRDKNLEAKEHQKSLAIRNFTEAGANYQCKHQQLFEKMRKGLKILRGLLEYVSIGKFDDNLKPLAAFFTDQFNEASKKVPDDQDIEINILLYTTFSMYIMI